MRRLHNINSKNSSEAVNKNVEEVYTQKIQTHIVSDCGVCFFSVLTYRPTSRQSSTEESYVAFADPLVGFFSNQKGAKAMSNPSRPFYPADEELLNGYQDSMDYIDDYDRHVASTEMEPTYV